MIDYLARRAAEGYVPEALEGLEGSEGLISAPLFPDVSVLAPRARTLYEQLVGSYVARRWPVADVVHAASMLVDMILRFDRLNATGDAQMLSEDDQISVLNTMAPLVEKYFEPETAPQTDEIERMILERGQGVDPALRAQWFDAMKRADAVGVNFHLDSSMVTESNPGQVLTYARGKWTCNCSRYAAIGDCEHLYFLRVALGTEEAWERDAP